MSITRPAISPSTYAMLAAAVIYGAIFTVNKLAATGGVPPFAYSFWQSFGAGMVLWLVLTLNGERLGVTRQHLIGYIVIGALVIGIPITLLTYIAAQAPRWGDDAGPGAVAAIHLHAERAGPAGAVPRHGAFRPALWLRRGGGGARGDAGFARHLEVVLLALAAPLLLALT